MNKITKWKRGQKWYVEEWDNEPLISLSILAFHSSTISLPPSHLSTIQIYCEIIEKSRKEIFKILTSDFIDIISKSPSFTKRAIICISVFVESSLKIVSSGTRSPIMQCEYVEFLLERYFTAFSYGIFSDQVVLL